MKFSLLFSAGFLFAVCSYAQNAKVNPNGHTDTNKLKVTLLKDSLFVTDKDQLVPVTSLGALDSLVKKLSNAEIHLETGNAEPEKIRSVLAVLNKCKCPVTKHSIAVNKN